MSSKRAIHTQEVQEVHNALDTQDVQEVPNTQEVYSTQDVQEVGGSMDNAVVLRGSAEVVQKYIDLLDVKPKSRETYRKALKQFMLFLESNAITQPTRADILKYKAYLMDNYKACTVSSYMTAVKGDRKSVV